MKPLYSTLFALTLLASTSCGYRHVRTAQDITPGNKAASVKLDWRYGSGDIQIQTSKVLGTLMDRWLISTGWICKGERPRIIVTDIDNRTDCYISTDMIRDIFEGVAVSDGRFKVVVGNQKDMQELDNLSERYQNSPHYAPSSIPNPGRATAPQFLAKVRITKAKTEQARYTLEDYRMTITLYDLETQEVIDSYWDVLSKKVCR